MAELQRIAHLRQQGTDRLGGVVDGLQGTGGDNFSGRTVDEAKTAGSAAARSLGWSPPYKWEGPAADGTYVLYATDTTLWPIAVSDEEE